MGVTGGFETQNMGLEHRGIWAGDRSVGCGGFGEQVMVTTGGEVCATVCCSFFFLAGIGGFGVRQATRGIDHSTSCSAATGSRLSWLVMGRAAV
jgi:hypothetical protein